MFAYSADDFLNLTESEIPMLTGESISLGRSLPQETDHRRHLSHQELVRLVVMLLPMVKRRIDAKSTTRNERVALG